MGGGLRAVRWASVVVTLAWCMPASAGALAAFRPQGEVVFPSPALAPTGVLWADAPFSEFAIRFHEGSPSGTAKLLLQRTTRVYDAENDTFFTAGLAESATRRVLAVGEFQSDEENGGGPAYSLVVGATPAGPFGPIVGTTKGTDVVGGLALDGDTLVTDQSVPTRAGPTNVRVLQRDLAAGGAPRQVGPAGATLGRAAGNYVAYALASAAPVAAMTSVTVVVAARATGVEIYRVSVASRAGRKLGLALQADGTVGLVVPTADPDGGSVVWASPGEPTPHVVAHDAIATDDFFLAPTLISLATGRLVYERHVAGKASASHDLGLVDLATGSVRAASFPIGPDFAGAQLDGTRLAYATGDCVYLAALSDPVPASAPTGTCPQFGLNLTATISTTVAAHVRCVLAAGAQADRCPESVTFRAPASRGHGPLTLATLHATPAPDLDATTTLRFSPTTRQRAQLRRRAHRGRVAIDVTATITDAGHVATSATRRVSLRL